MDASICLGNSRCTLKFHCWVYGQSTLVGIEVRLIGNALPPDVSALHPCPILPMQAHEGTPYCVALITPPRLTFPGLPSREPVFASLPVPCSKKIPYPPRTDIFPFPKGSHAKPIRGAGLKRCPVMHAAGTGVPSLYLSTSQRTKPLVK